MGKILLNSTYLKPDHEQARSWFLIAAQAQYGPAYNMLGRCSHFGWGCDRELSQAVSYYQKAAQLGDLWGCYNLGIMTLRGLGIQANRADAYLLFRKAALQGHAKSMNLLARFIEEGWETPRNPQAALEWYKRSAEGEIIEGSIITPQL
ncbi:tetratricopeptide repeat protein [Aristophania vespae]|uniref:tetratricopeptide repeat protein n=1 Tax=Aristophania vespae TaxID=2697033 RepID=UPI001F396A19|nr:tetratricopeptide repeat protein [Aristophania vespae]